ncbi:helix-turn-helix transcriptional regulator [Lacticaseibacillus chiayiensis]|uniref:Helix-turn-helix transcriptional regulator n=1 Tax=Lacticaseibacillus chiayiensis TaxID=2100821 RepID=A0ABY6H378_9LACO|nr:helix-turn-helix transcriptional regulator [Lacticaseibacillus chiayiensis]UYN55646.1 helix-turn-helix transcriptional regulator [Lacticaseibacillus chiayiensis]
MVRDEVIRLRENAGFTQAQLGEQLGISAVHVRKIEKGTRNPSKDLTERYVTFFGLPADEIFPDIYEKLIDTKRITPKHSPTQREEVAR